MSLFSSILEELTKKLHSGEQSKKEISETVSEVIGISISPDQISVKNGALFLSISPTIKTVVLLRKQKLLEVLQKYNITTIG